MDERRERTDAVDAHLDAWLDDLRHGPDVPLPERLETPPVAPARSWRPSAAGALLAAAALIACSIVAVRLSGTDRGEQEIHGPELGEDDRDRPPPVSAFRGLTRARTFHLEAWSTTIRHDNEGTQIAGHRLVAHGE